MSRPSAEELTDAVVVLSGAIQNSLQRAAWETFAEEIRALRAELAAACHDDELHLELRGIAEGHELELRGLQDDVRELLAALPKRAWSERLTGAIQALQRRVS